MRKSLIFVLLFLFLLGLSIVSSYSCYQESANISTSCGGLSTGNYAETPGSAWEFPWSRIVDGDWNTDSTDIGTISGIYINYSIPTFAENATWEVKTKNNVTSINYSIPLLCFNKTRLQLRLYSVADNTSAAGHCYNGSSWEKIFDYHSDPWIYEEAVLWHILSSPEVNLVTPSNNSVLYENITFTFNTSDNTSILNATLYIWNSTNSLINISFTNISGIYNSTSFNYTFAVSDTYKWNVLVTNNENYSSFASSNNTVIVDLINPIINNIFPSNNFWVNSNYLNLTCSIYQSSNLGSGFLYGNFTGTWGLNQTNNSILSNVNTYYPLNLTDGFYNYICACNKTTGSTLYYSQSGNYSFGVDTIYPVGYNMTITPSAGSQTFHFINNVTDLNLDSCKYSIYNSSDGIDGLNNNVSFTCNIDSTATTTSYGIFKLFIYSKDKAGNEISQNLSFTTSPSSGTPSTGGGGVSYVVGNKTWTMTTSTGIDSYSFQMMGETSREGVLQFRNTGSEKRIISISCEGELCKYILLLNNTIELPVSTTTYKILEFTVSIPSNVTITNLKANLIGKDELGNSEIVTVDVTLGTFGFITDIILSLSDPVVLLEFAGIWLFSTFLLFLITNKKKWGLGVSVILGLILGIFFIALNGAGLW